MSEPHEMPAVALRPTDTQVSVGYAEGSDGSRWVQIIFSTPQGFNAFFLSHREAEETARAMLQMAASARTGIVVAQSVAESPTPQKLSS